MLLSDVCLSVAYIGRNLRTERPRKTKIGTEVAHVTRDSDTTFKVKRSKVKVTRPLWLVVLAGQHGHIVMVTYPYAYLTYIVSPLAGLCGGISWRPPAYSLLIFGQTVNSNATWTVTVQLRSTSYYIMSAKIALKPISDTAYVETWAISAIGSITPCGNCGAEPTSYKHKHLHILRLKHKNGTQALEITAIITFSFTFTGTLFQGNSTSGRGIQRVGRQEGHPACKKTGCSFVGGDDLTGALHVL